jgi:hypothetical protein
VADDFDVGVIGAMFLRGALAESLDDLLDVVALEIYDGAHVEVGRHKLGLADRPRDSVEKEILIDGLKAAGGNGFRHRVAPEPDGQFIGDEGSGFGIFGEFAADFGVGIERAEHVAAGEVMHERHSAEDFSLCSFAAAGRAEE